MLLLTLCAVLGIAAARPVAAQYLELKHYAGDPGVRDRLGESAAIDGTLALIGAFRDDERGLDAGAAYVFRLEGLEWVQEAKLTPTGPLLDGDLLAGDLFGSVVALSGNIAVVGAPEARLRGNRVGAAYIFERRSEGEWIQTARLLPDPGSVDNKFATTVATNGVDVFVGALDEDDQGINSGAVYVYRRPETDVDWALAQKLLASDGLQGDSFGWWVAVDGDRAVIGARDVDAVADNAGAAYVVEKKAGVWTETARLLASDGAADDSFGETVAIHGDRIAVGARDVASGIGQAYVYELTPTGWVESARLRASDGVPGDLNAHAVAIRGDHLFVATRNDNDRRGAVYVYERMDGSWIESSKLAPADLGPDDQYGQAVSVGDRWMVISSKHDDDAAEDAGAVYFYDLQNTDRGALMALFNATNGPGWDNRVNWGTSTPLGTWAGVKTDDEGFVSELALNGNDLSGAIPAALGTLQRITVLDLFENNLTGSLPPSLGDLTTLKTLRLYTNQLSGTLPAELGRLVQLEHLALGGNLFTGTIPAALGGMTALREFYIPSNLLDGAVPPELAALPNLQIFRAAFNNLTGLPDFSAAAGRITSLRVHTNRLTFEDLEPNVGLTGFEYIPQNNFGESRSISINEGEPLTIDIPIGGANNRYQWYRDNEVIDGATQRVFARTSATPQDAGTYTLEVTNTAVAGLTLMSQPVVVEVSNAERFDAHLESLNVLPPFDAPAVGDLTAILSENRMIVTGSFENLVNPYNGAALYVGSPANNGIQVATLTATIAGSGGTFDPERNSFTVSTQQADALRSGSLYAVVFTTRTDVQGAVQETIRGQFYRRPNQAPGAPELTGPDDGAVLDLSVAGGSLNVNWSAVTDPDGHPVHYLWAYAREAEFGSIDGVFRTDQSTSIAVPYATLDAFLASRGVPAGGSLTLYHRAIASDGSLLAEGPARAITLRRTANNAPPFVASAIVDRIHLLGDSEVSIPLRGVFGDPESDPLTFEAGSDNLAVATVEVVRDTLIVTPLAIGRAQITVQARDPRGGMAQDVFTFTVNAAPVVVTSLEDRTLVEGDAPLEIALAGVFSDADALTYSAASGTPGVATATIAGDGVTLLVSPIAPGSALITVTATDDKLAAASTTFTVQIEEDRITPPLSVAESVNLTFGDPTRSTSYRLVGLPGAVALPMAQAIAGVADTDWIAYRERGDPDAQPDAIYQKYDGSALFEFRPGRGFWLLSRQPWARNDARSTVQLDANDEFAIPLQPGWNIISNPFDIDLRWSDIQARNEVTQTLFAWNGAFNASATFASARTGQAYYFFNAGDKTSLLLPYQPAPAGAAPPPRGITLTARAADTPASQVVAGIVSETPVDQLAPPRGFEQTSLRLIRSDGGTLREWIEAYAEAGEEGYRFEVVLESDRPATIEAGNLEVLAGRQAVLVEAQTGKPYVLDAVEHVVVSAGAGRTDFILLVGSDAYISVTLSDLAPAAPHLAQNYPNPFSAGTIIEYAVPELTRVKLVVYDVLGRLVDVLVDAEQQAGFYALRWEGTQQGGPLVRSGVYMYRLEIGDTRVTRTMTILR